MLEVNLSCSCVHSSRPAIWLQLLRIDWSSRFICHIKTQDARWKRELNLKHDHTCPTARMNMICNYVSTSKLFSSSLFYVVVLVVDVAFLFPVACMHEKREWARIARTGCSRCLTSSCHMERRTEVLPAGAGTKRSVDARTQGITLTTGETCNCFLLQLTHCYASCSRCSWNLHCQSWLKIHRCVLPIHPWWPRWLLVSLS